MPLRTFWMTTGIKGSRAQQKGAEQKQSADVLTRQLQAPALLSNVQVPGGPCISSAHKALTCYTHTV